MTGPLALIVVLLVAILAPSFYFVYRADADQLERRPRREEES